VKPSLFAPLPTGPFEIVYADPPWDYKGRKQFGFAGDVGEDTGGAINQYPTVPLETLKALPVSEIVSDNALLFMWVTGPMMDSAFPLAKAWGFSKYGTVAFDWDKRRTNPGYYTLSQHEYVLVFKRGKIPRPRGTRNERQRVCKTRSKHSSKPVIVRRRIERMFPNQSKIELFARDTAEGWTSWGNEVPND